MHEDLEDAIFSDDFMEEIRHLREEGDYVVCDYCGDTVDSLDTELVYNTRDDYCTVCRQCIKDDEDIVLTHYINIPGE